VYTGTWWCTVPIEADNHENHNAKSLCRRDCSTPAPAIDFIKPLTPDQQKTSIEFFNILNFVLR
jgi:hypothetical protein